MLAQQAPHLAFLVFPFSSSFSHLLLLLRSFRPDPALRMCKCNQYPEYCGGGARKSVWDTNPRPRPTTSNSYIYTFACWEPKPRKMGNSRIGDDVAFALEYSIQAPAWFQYISLQNQTVGEKYLLFPKPFSILSIQPNRNSLSFFTLTLFVVDVVGAARGWKQRRQPEVAVRLLTNGVTGVLSYIMSATMDTARRSVTWEIRVEERRVFTRWIGEAACNIVGRLISIRLPLLLGCLFNDDVIFIHQESC